MTQFKFTTTALACALALPASLQAQELSLAYFMGPGHHLNASVFTPFAERLETVSDGKMTIRQFPGGALNSVPPQQYSIIRDGVADIGFIVTGFTGDLFPRTNTVSLPTVCDDAVACTEALWRAKDVISAEYEGHLLAVWSADPPVLISRNTAVRTMDDLAGMKIRVNSPLDVPFVQAMGATPVSQPVNVINQNLANGVIDAIAIDPAAILSFQLQEPASYITTDFPGSGTAFVLMINQGVYDGFSDAQKGWLAEASGEWLSIAGADSYSRASQAGLEAAVAAGVEMIAFSEEDARMMDDAMLPVLENMMGNPLGDTTVGALVETMRGAR